MSYREQENNDRFDALANKLSTLRQVTNDIHGEASETGLLDTMTNAFDSLSNGLRTSGGRLTRVMNSNNSTWRIVVVLLGVFVIGYTLSKVF